MKIAICSDLHLEFADIHLKNEDNADVLILGGDICVVADIGRPDPYDIMEGTRSNRIVDFFKRCSFQFPHVVYVMGNHEHYHGDFKTSGEKLRKLFLDHSLGNIHFLDKEFVVIEDTMFIGGTLWTDMNKEDPITMQSMTSMMNDFRCVANSNREVSFKAYNAAGEFTGMESRTAKFSPADAVEDHKAMLSFLEETLKDNPPERRVVVVGHHAPSKSSTHPRYRTETIMNGGYSSELSDFILDHREIKLWTDGHTHEDFDYMIGSTRVVCNPRGYEGYERRADRFELKVVEV